jgi:hypothetical protein
MKTLSYILLSSILLFAPHGSAAQEKDKQDEKKKKETFWNLFAFKGFGFSADIFGCAYSLIGEGISTEIAAEVNFGNRLYPIAEVGWAWCNTTDETSRIKYRTNAPYYKAGFNYNFLTKRERPNPKHYVYGLIRIGWTNFKYNVEAPAITDPVWGGSVALNLQDAAGACIWGEVGAGIKVKIAKGFHMGWSIHYKIRFTEKRMENSRMWYIPGYGINQSTCFGGTYNLIYDIPIIK